MKYIIVTDTHLGIKKGDDVYMNSIYDLFDNICEYAYEHKIKNIIHCGDFFDTRKSLSLKVIESAQNIMDKLEDIFDEIYLIIGNHDTYLKNQIKPTSLSIFKEYNKTYVIDEPYITDGILLLLWLFDKDILKNCNADTCIGHFDINGIEMNASGFTPLYQKLNISDFNEFKTVFSGHYHVSSMNSNIKYLGSPIQFTFNEIGKETGYYVYDSDSHDIEFIEFDNYPKHMIMYDSDNSSSVDIKGNNIKLIFKKDYGIERNLEIINSIKIKEPNNLKISYFNLNNYMTTDVIESDINIKSKTDILFDFYDKSDLPDGIKYGILIKIVNNLKKEINGE